MVFTDFLGLLGCVPGKGDFLPWAPALSGAAAPRLPWRPGGARAPPPQAGAERAGAGGKRLLPARPEVRHLLAEPGQVALKLGAHAQVAPHLVGGDDDPLGVVHRQLAGLGQGHAV